MTYCRGVDRRDADMVLSTFHEDAVDDHGQEDTTPQTLVAAIMASPAK